MPLDKLPQVPFGAVYFRKSNPPREDWERDYGVAAEDGLNVFRHWFMWGSIERKPGRLRLGRLRPADGPRRQERHQDHHRRTDPHRARLGLPQVRARAAGPRRRPAADLGHGRQLLDRRLRQQRRRRGRADHELPRGEGGGRARSSRRSRPATRATRRCSATTSGTRSTTRPTSTTRTG